MLIFSIIITVIIVEFIFEQWLDYLNLKNLSEKLPEELQDIYDEEKYANSQKYERSTTKFSFYSSLFDLLFILAILFCGGFAILQNFVSSISGSPIIQGGLFFGIYVTIKMILKIPFDVYGIFVIEEKFGFNKTTPKTYIGDKIKSTILSFIINAGLIALMVWFYNLTPVYFWLWGWGAGIVIILFINYFYSTLIVPLFNKQKPLEDGELKTQITLYAEKAGFKLDKIFTIDGSKRSTKANAYFTGFGRKKRIVLFDTLVNDFSVNEIVAVLLHEIGHYKKKHILTNMILSFFQIGLMLFILSLFVSKDALSQALGVEAATFHIGLVAFNILYGPIAMILGIFMNMYSRKNEYQADNFTKLYDMGNYLIDVLKKLNLNSLSNLTPHPKYVFFYYSHPTLLQRVRMLKG